MRSKILLYYNDLVFQPSDAFLFKDFGQVPFVMSELYNADLEYWIATASPNKEFNQFRGKPVRQFNKSHSYLPRRLDILKNASLYREIKQKKDFTHLFLFPFTPLTDLVVARSAAKRGIKIIVKLDTNGEYLQSLANDWRRKQSHPLRFTRQSYHYRELLKMADLVLCETSECEAILLDEFLGIDLAAKLVKTFSGLSATWLKAIGVNSRPSSERRNAIIVSGRISSWQKYSELIFQAGPPPIGWTIEFVGEVSAAMSSVIERYRNLDPMFDKQYRFHGAIANKRAYFDLLFGAKALLMNSRGGEGFPNVYAEAHFCGLFLVTSDVSGATDATDEGRWGLIYKREDVEALRIAIAEIPIRVAAAQDIPAFEGHRQQFIWERSLYQPAVKQLFEKLVPRNCKAI